MEAPSVEMGKFIVRVVLIRDIRRVLLGLLRVGDVSENSLCASGTLRRSSGCRLLQKVVESV